MLAEAVQELPTGKGCELMFPSLAIILVLERDRGVCHLFDPVVAYGHPVRVTSQVFDHLLCSHDRGFAVDYPVFGEQFLPYGLWNRHLFTEHAHKLGTEHTAHTFDRKEKRTILFGAGYILPKPLLVDSPARDDAMQMGMVMQIASPGM